MSYLQELEDQRLGPVRRVVREEIVKALQALAREAEHQDSYDTPEITSRALDALHAAAEGAVKRLTCEHEYDAVWGPRCTRCGEPEPEPVNPFEEAGRG